MREQKLVGISKAAAILGVHPNTLRSWADNGLVPHVKLPSGYRRFNEDEMREFREQLEVNENPKLAA